jgi:hypothetical protein
MTLNNTGQFSKLIRAKMTNQMGVIFNKDKFVKTSSKNKNNFDSNLLTNCYLFWTDNLKIVKDSPKLINYFIFTFHY